MENAWANALSKKLEYFANKTHESHIMLQKDGDLLVINY